MDSRALATGAAALLGVATGAAALLYCTRASAPGTVLHRVGLVSDFAVGSKTEVDVPVHGGGKTKVLLLRTHEDRFRATSARCPHANVPLVGGVLSGDRLICPAHAACFNVATGDIEDGCVWGGA